MAVETAWEVLQPLVATCITFIVLITVFVILRFVARFQVKQQKIGLDDAFIVAGFVVNIGLCVDALVIYHYESLGDTPAHLPVENPAQIEPILKAIYAAEQLLYAGFTFPKLSLLFLYLRVFEARWSKFVTWGLIGVTTLCWVAFSLTAAFLCQPARFYWDRTAPGGQCMNIDTFWRAIPPFNIVTDIVTLLLPIPIVWKLEASRLKKLGVIFIFLTGGVGLVTCCVRWGVYLTHSAQQIWPNVTGPMLSWAIIEAGVYEIAACLPMMRPVFIALTPKRLRTKWHTWTGTSAAYHPGHKSSRASGQILGGRTPKNFSRLQDSDSVISPYSPAAEKAPLSEAGVTSGYPSDAEQIQLKDLPSRGIQRKVDVSVTKSSAS